jgi:dihydrofolate reductase
MLTLIAAVSANGCIGKNGGLPWIIPADLSYFKKQTIGKVVVMGRKTWESIPEKFRPLPGRTNVVITRQRDYKAQAEIFHSLGEVLMAHAGEEIIVAGGSEIYREAMPRVEKMFITHVHKDVDGDAFFPEIDPKIWEETARIDQEGYSWVTYSRRAEERV